MRAPPDPGDRTRAGPAQGGPSAALAQTLIGLSSDIALLVDSAGVVTSLARNARAPADAESWVGRRWIDAATTDTSNKVARLLADASTAGMGRPREVNHASDGGDEVAMLYTALRVGVHGPVLVVGHNLHDNSALQQRFLHAQQALECSYWQARQHALRERQCQEVAEDEVLAVDLAGPWVVAHNAGTKRLLCKGSGRLEGRPLESLFEARSWPAVAALLDQACRLARPIDTRARLAGTHANVAVTVLPLDRGDAGPAPTRALLRLRPAEMAPPPAKNPKESSAVIICDSAGLVCNASESFLALAGALEGESLQRRVLNDWLQARRGATALLDTVLENGLVNTDKIWLHRPRRGDLRVAVSGALLGPGPVGRCGFTVRPLPSLVSGPAPAAQR